MYRREFLKQSAAAFAVANLPSYAGQLGDMRKRVGLIGTGWYGKSDLLRLIQVAPVEVVSLCDVDKMMLSRGGRSRGHAAGVEETAAHSTATTARCCSQGDLDIVAHRHARSLARAADDRGGQGRARRLRPEADQRRRGGGAGDARGGAEVQARGAGRHAAPQHAAPGARARPGDPRGPARHHRPGRDLLLLPHARDAATRRTRPPPANLDYEMWTGPAPMRPYNSLVHPRSWRAFMEYGNGIVGDMCVHMLDMVRWMLDLGLPRAHQFRRAASWSTRRARPTSPTRRPRRSISATCRSSGSTASYGDAPDPKYPWGATFYGDKGTLKAGRHGLRLRAAGKDRRRPRGRHLRIRAVPRGSDREGPGAPRGAGHPRPHEELPRVHRVTRHAGRRHRAGLHLGSRLHPGQPCRCGSAARSSGITPKASWSTMQRRTRCCAGRTGRRGSIRIRPRSDGGAFDNRG